LWIDPAGRAIIYGHAGFFLPWLANNSSIFYACLHNAAQVISFHISIP
jgi:hypothetical protein